MKDLKPSQDEYGEIYNSEETYKWIVEQLSNIGSSVLVGWTDELGSHFDILFTYSPMAINKGTFQGGVKPYDLFVSIMRVGSFGFEIANIDTHYAYYGEKLGMGSNETTKKIGELINNIKIKLNERN